ncbi:alpha/beta fold hydrolase [Roseibium sp. MMSF_3412]|uniref:alpha/beta fold hydrolase n=1 Tax=Roseibium sp. MMSF_3412 TaxID=3046712 RepID=UPI00273D9073|nr:alpha/beta fold hydrolase [Roseibium sp. MMSF_3412]
MSALPLVFIPGLLCTETLYAPQITAFSDRPILVADNRSDDTIGAIAARLLKDAPERFSLIGLSMGGYIAFEVMRRAPERVDRLALLNTSAQAVSEERREQRQVLTGLAQKNHFHKIPDLFFPGFVHENNETSEHLRSIVHGMAAETGRDAFIRQQNANAARMDSRPSLSHISCPTFVLSGDGDRLIAPDLSVEIHQLVAGSELAILEECGHLSTLEQPEHVTAKLRAFLA